jgi:hypothetical protein
VTDKGPKRTVRTHGASGYRAGCKCTVCTLAESERKRNFRATGTGAKQATTANVTPLRSNVKGRARTSARATTRAPQPPSQRPPVIGDNEAAVRAQCEGATRAADQPGTVAQAITLAKILDREDLIAMHANTSRQLHVLLQSLAGPKLKSKGKLVAIQKMTNRRPAGADSGAVQGE